MNSPASILFVLLFLIKGLAPGMDLCCELQKVPNLFEHYEEHKACTDDSFFQFLVNDYLNFDGGAREHHDDKSHDNLPFHGSHQCCQPSVFYAAHQSFSLASFEFVSQVEFAYYNSFHPSEFLDSPFQPPQA